MEVIRDVMTPAPPAPVTPAAPLIVPPPSLASWEMYFKFYGPDVPLPVAMAWTKEESGGIPCAIGDLPPPGATQPREYGLAQLNVGDPSNVKIGTAQALRPMCAFGTTQEEWKAATHPTTPAARALMAQARKRWESLTRPMTEGEKIEHVVAAIELMRHCAKIATKYLGGDQLVNQGGGGVWNAADFWRLAKCYHFSSAVCNEFPQVQAALGRLPTWLEFKDGANDISLAYTRVGSNGKEYHPYSQSWLDGGWRNVDVVGDAMLSKDPNI